MESTNGTVIEPEDESVSTLGIMWLVMACIFAVIILSCCMLGCCSNCKIHKVFQMYQIEVQEQPPVTIAFMYV